LAVDGVLLDILSTQDGGGEKKKGGEKGNSVLPAIFDRINRTWPACCCGLENSGREGEGRRKKKGIPEFYSRITGQQYTYAYLVTLGFSVALQAAGRRRGKKKMKDLIGLLCAFYSLLYDSSRLISRFWEKEGEKKRE